MRKDLIYLGAFGVNCLIILLNLAAFGWVYCVELALLFNFMLFCVFAKILSEFSLNKKSKMIDKIIFIVAVGLTISGAFMLIDSTEPTIWPFSLSSFIIVCLAYKVA